MIVLAFTIGYIDDISGPQHHHYQETTVKVYKKYQCPKNCAVIHPHFVYFNSHTDGMVIDESLLGKKVKKKKSRRKK
jgi:hypothetical protein